MKLLIVAILSFLSGCFYQSLDSKIEKLKGFGLENFTQEKWISSTQEKRAGMIYSFFKKHDIKKMNADDIRATLGKQTGYYDYDEYPAYFIGSSSVESMYGKGYLIAFIIDSQSGLVSDIIIEPEI